MQFIWYGALPFLLLIPVLIWGYWRIQRRHARYALRYSSLFVVNQAIDKKPDFRRHIPPGVFLSAVSFMLLALTRPYTIVPSSTLSRTVILTIDVSASMMRGDVKPNRLEAAKSAARDFVMQQDPDLEIGLVAFSETASLVQLPTANREAVLKAVDRLQIDSSTAIGSGILTSLYAIAGRSFSGYLSPVMQLQAVNSSLSDDLELPGAIVLLTDGQNVVGPSPIDAAEQAAHHGVRIYTIGIGTISSRVSRASNLRDELDEGTLTQIADITRAKYFRAFDETALSEIYRNLHLQISIKEEKAELAPGLTALAIVLFLAGATLSYLWNGGIP
jgi:Ca-activated chloride channel family protein